MKHNISDDQLQNNVTTIYTSERNFHGSLILAKY